MVVLLGVIFRKQIKFYVLCFDFKNGNKNRHSSIKKPPQTINNASFKSITQREGDPGT